MYPTRVASYSRRMRPIEWTLDVLHLCGILSHSLSKAMLITLSHYTYQFSLNLNLDCYTNSCSLFSSHQEYLQDGKTHMRMKFYVQGTDKKADVNLEVVKVTPGYLVF